MKYQYRLKDKRAEFFKRTSVKDNRGVVTYLGRAVSPLWCYTQNLSGDILNSPPVIQNNETRLFVFNFRADFAQGDFVRYKGKWYEITRFNTTADYNDEVYAYVRDHLPVDIEGGASDE